MRLLGQNAAMNRRRASLVFAVAATAVALSARADHYSVEYRSMPAYIYTDYYAWESEVGDFDGDGQPDLVALMHARNAPLFLHEVKVVEFALGLGNSGNLLEKAVSPAFTAETTALALADLDGDGRRDAVVTDRYYDEATNHREWRMQLLPRAAAYAAPAPLAAGATATKPVRGDIDRDGFEDLVSMRWLEPPGVAAVYEFNFIYGGSGGVREVRNDTQPIRWLAQQRLGDLDGDGWLDLWYTVIDQDPNPQTHNSYTIEVRWGGAAGFAAAQPLLSGIEDASFRERMAAQAYDVDGDGDADLVWRLDARFEPPSMSDPGFRDTRFEWARNDGARAFAAPAALFTSRRRGEITLFGEFALGDADADGDTDVIESIAELVDHVGSSAHWQQWVEITDLHSGARHRVRGSGYETVHGVMEADGVAPMEVVTSGSSGMSLLRFVRTIESVPLARSTTLHMSSPQSLMYGQMPYDPYNNDDRLFEWIVISPPAHAASFAYDPYAGTFAYQSDGSADSGDSFSFVITDGTLTSPVRTVTLDFGGPGSDPVETSGGGGAIDFAWLALIGIAARRRRRLRPM
jgi:hypothetical protein